MKNTFLIGMIIISSCVAGSAVQTDWSEGISYQDEPVSEWASTFSSANHSNWLYNPGELSIGGIFVDDPVCTQIKSAPTFISQFHTADMDQDGDTDIVATNCGQQNDSLVWLENTIEGNWPLHIVTIQYEPYHSFEVVDLNGDGYTDLLCQAFGREANICWFQGDGTGDGWIEHTITDQQFYSHGINMADMDLDGDMDVISGTYSDEIDGMSWWENIDGSGDNWVQHVMNTGYSGASDIEPGDFDGDGDIDIAVAAGYINHTYSWWENADGAGITWTEHTLGPCGGAPRLDVLDIDRDNDLDIVTSSAYGNQTGVWYNENNQGQFEYFTIGWGQTPCITVSDFEHDGNVSVAAGLFSEERVVLWESFPSETATLWIEREIEDWMRYPFTISSGDLDGDSYHELLSCSHPYTSISHANHESQYLEYLSSPGVDGLCEMFYWNIVQPAEEAWLESSILHVSDCEPDWQTVDWDCQAPSGTSVLVRVRSSDNPLSMGDWSDTMTMPCELPESVADGDNYLQYRIFLTKDPHIENPPILESIAVSWNPLGIEDFNQQDNFDFLLPFSPNPCTSSPVINFSLASSSTPEFDLFDISGRLVAGLPETEYQAGTHNVSVEGLTPGLYFCRMRTTGYESARSFILLK